MDKVKSFSTKFSLSLSYKYSCCLSFIKILVDERSRQIDACKNKCNKPNNKCNEIDEKCECLTGYAEDQNGNCKCILGMMYCNVSTKNIFMTRWLFANI